MISRSWTRALVVAATATCIAAVSACSSSSSGGGAPGSAAPEPALHVVASFYPLQYVVERIGGDRVAVSNLTPVGAEPHDLELDARDAVAMQDADMVVYLSGFSPAVDAGADELASNAFDVAPFANLDLTFSPIEEGQQSGEGTDPHFWLDPTRLADVADEVANRLGELDPGGAEMYLANATELDADLDGLDSDFEAGLATCTNRDIVTSHNAFGYLAERYDMTQVGITGLTPEEEPSPGDLAAVADFVEQNNVKTIYYETLVSPKIADTIASETGATTAVLDPIEGLTADSRGSDYLAIMRANLVNLRQGQGCT